MKLLIVNADDFGINDAANAAIIECHRMGSVTSTTLMANGPALAAAVELGRCNPSLGIGLHFNLTWGEPVSDPAMVSALVDDKGRFLAREVLAKRSLLGRIPREQLEIELDAQFKRLLSLGVDVTHVDSHQHVHALGVVFSTVAALCSRESLPMRVPWVAKERGAGLRRRLRRASLAALLTHSTGRWSGSVRWNDALGSVFDLGVVGGSLETAHYVAILEAAKSGVFELMVHPVTSASAMKGYTRVGAVGEAEYHWLRKGELPSLAESMGFRLGTYRDLP
ncbi:MAG: carbohydrate deacetylase [Porticoccaceae bacterium]